MIRTTRPAPLAFATAVALTLAACGGGGGGGSAAPTPAPPPPAPAPAVAAAGTLQATVPAPTYAASSVQASMFTKLNDIRSQAGAGVIAQSAQIDVAAQAHADYLHINPADGHTEVAGKTGYYAATGDARITKAGYSQVNSTETIGGTGISGLGKDCALGLLSTLYHGAALLSPFKDGGYGSALDPLGAPTCVTDLANPTGTTYQQVPAAGALVTYPYNGQADAIETFYVSAEVPRPPVSVLPNATAGTPVLVSIRNADYVNFKVDGSLSASVTKFEIRDGASNLVPAVVFSASGITGSGVTLNVDTQLPEGFVVLVPQAPLLKNATYTSSFTATLKAGGTALTKTWSFKTNP